MYSQQQQPQQQPQHMTQAADNSTTAGGGKRHAKGGQWRTPPTPAFFPAPSNLNDIPIPESSDDYALALQEAYRRGAQAAAAISSQSSPDIIANNNTNENNQQTFAPANTQAPATILENRQAPPSDPLFTTSFTTSAVANPLAQSQPQPVPAQAPQPTAAPSPTMMAPAPSQQPSSTTNRSVSLPDINSYAARALAEEDKRQKRLARNRASARLRRLKKKNLVDSYETEVGVLESSLAKLRAHRWGIGTDMDALLDALSMDRGQQSIDAEKRKEFITKILAQQREQVHNVMECQMENYLLKYLSGGCDESDAEEIKEEQDQEDAELDAMTQELNDILQLTPQQKQEIQEATKGIEEEMKSIDTIETCLQDMLDNSWLMNHGVEEATAPFMAILNQGQVSKFLLWTDHNSDAIDRLDYLHAPPVSLNNHNPQQPQYQAPTFVFGVDETDDTVGTSNLHTSLPEYA